MPGKILIDITLYDAVTLDQFVHMLGFTEAALGQFAHLIETVKITSTPPAAIEVPLTITVIGAAQENVVQDILSKVSAALTNTNGVQYHVQVAGEVVEAPAAVAEPVTRNLALTPATIP